MRDKIIIGTRASALAIAQSQWVAARLEAAHPGLAIELVRISTRGDTITDVPLSRMEGKGVFTKELERALLDERADLAVHSMKDVPTELAPVLDIGCVPEREDPHDVLVARGANAALHELPQGSVIGTSSLRRAAQLRAARPDLHVEDIRGNVDTRLRKLATGSLAAIIIARAGLNRLGLLTAGEVHLAAAPNCTAANVPFHLMLPAAGQGALAIEIRANDAGVRALLAPLNDHATFTATSAERRLLALIGGGCHVPLGAYARIVGGQLRLDAVLCSLDGNRVLRTSMTVPTAQWQTAADRAYQDFLRDGAKEIVDEINGRT